MLKRLLLLKLLLLVSCTVTVDGTKGPQNNQDKAGIHKSFDSRGDKHGDSSTSAPPQVRCPTVKAKQECKTNNECPAAEICVHTTLGTKPCERTQSVCQAKCLKLQSTCKTSDECGENEFCMEYKLNNCGKSFVFRKCRTVNDIPDFKCGDPTDELICQKNSDCKEDHVCHLQKNADCGGLGYCVSIYRKRP